MKTTTTTSSISEAISQWFTTMIDHLFVFILGCATGRSQFHASFYLEIVTYITHLSDASLPPSQMPAPKTSKGLFSNSNPTGTAKTKSNPGKKIHPNARRFDNIFGCRPKFFASLYFFWFCFLFQTPGVWFVLFLSRYAGVLRTFFFFFFWFILSNFTFPNIFQWCLLEFRLSSALFTWCTSSIICCFTYSTFWKVHSIVSFFFTYLISFDIDYR